LHDEQLVQKAKGGDQAAFAELVGRFRPYAYAIAWNITLNEDDALDVTQEVWMQVAQKIGTLELPGSFKAWLAAVAARQAIDHCRKPARRREIATDADALDEALESAAGGSTPASAVQVLERQRRLALVHRAMEELSPQQRAILTLMLKEDLQPGEVAEQLGLGGSAVRTQLHRAIQAIRERLNLTKEKVR